MGTTEPLPADLLAAILGRLEPRWLAASRCVRKAWRAVVDDGRLLRADLLPLSVSGIFFVAHESEIPPYLSRPPHEPISVDFSYLVGDYLGFLIKDHCNGLLLVDDDLMVNPTTRRWVRLPSPPDPPPCIRTTKEYLAFDPAFSPHYEVFLIHNYVPPKEDGEAEWPPSPYVLRVFSSSSYLWEVREFIREGGAAGAVADMVPDNQLRWYYSAYWRGALYVRQHDFVMRISSSKNTYRVIKLPKCTFSLETETVSASEYRLGKSKKGVYCAVIVSYFKLWIWFLEESCDNMVWIPRKEADLEPLLANLPLKQTDGPWRQNVHDMRREAPMKEELEWDSDDDNISGTQEASNNTEETYIGVFIVGFHPSKEILFLLTAIKYNYWLII